MKSIPAIRLSPTSQRSDDRGEFILYWMTTARRLEWNFSLEHAADRARELDLPLLIVEALPLDYPWANARRHRFLLDGMLCNLTAARSLGADYYPFVEHTLGQATGLLEHLAARSALVVTDAYPIDAPARITEAMAELLEAPTQWVDANGLIPLAATPKAFTRAYSFRIWIHKVLEEHLLEFPAPNPLKAPEQAEFAPLRRAPAPLLNEIGERWPAAKNAQLQRGFQLEMRLPIAQTPAPTSERGGSEQGRRVLDSFVDAGLPRYAEERNHPDRCGASGLSPWLHHGHISTHEIIKRVLDEENWDPGRLGMDAPGKKGFWGVSVPAADFLDELITWRELGFNFCYHRADFDQFDSLPEWARRTLDEHAHDPRCARYDFNLLEHARTDDEIWNAAQRELIFEGRMHNYLRMLWGKKILEWSATPEDALATMIELNNRYALDGCDPNSYSGIFWVLGRYDRAWGPEREIFGKIRYMSSQSARRKLKMRDYLQRYARSARQQASLL